MRLLSDSGNICTVGVYVACSTACTCCACRFQRSVHRNYSNVVRSFWDMFAVGIVHITVTVSGIFNQKNLKLAVG